MREMTIDATVENLDTVTDFINEHLEECGCSMKVQTQIAIVVDELFSNIAHYAYNPEVGPATVCVEVTEGDEPTVSITMIDGGVPYDPLAKEDPDITASAEERDIGGLGIFMVKQMMDDIEYRYEDGKNILTVRKKM